jgi:predicted HicB family RNase H-like nuclease
MEKCAMAKATTQRRAAKLGRPRDPETASKRQITLVMDGELHHRIKIAAATEEITISEWVQTACGNALMPRGGKRAVA